MLFLPIYDDNPTRRTPVVTMALIALCVMVFLWQLSLGARGGDLAVYSFGLVPAVLFGHAELPEPLRVVPPWMSVITSMFMHGGFLHLAGNMLYLWIFGNNVEDRLGRGGFLLFYLVGGVLAALAQVAIDPNSPVPTIGASGAIAATLGAYLVFYPGARVTSLVFLGFFYQLMNIPAAIVLVLWFGLQLLSGIGSLGVSQSGGVAFFAHIGGFVFGAFVAWVVRALGTGRRAG